MLEKHSARDIRARDGGPSFTQNLAVCRYKRSSTNHAGISLRCRNVIVPGCSSTPGSSVGLATIGFGHEKVSGLVSSVSDE